MLNRSLLCSALWLVLTSMSCLHAAETPNIVLIVGDNQTASLLGSYGNSHIRTPNIDRLAAEGVLFEHAYAANGVCSPTRATLLTGLMPSQTGVHVALQAKTDIPGWSAIEEFRSLPQTLADAGYATALVGKYHLGNHDQPQLGFDEWVTFTSGHTTAFYGVQVIDNGESYTVDRHLTDFWTGKAEEFLARQNEEQPFFLYLAYNGPYMLPPSVLLPPRNRHAQYYSEHTPPFPQEPVHPYLQNWAQGRGPTGIMVKEGTTAWTSIQALNNRTAMINTAAETTMVDDGVGRILQALNELDFDDNTIVIYMADQGASYGHHGLWGNTSWSYPFTAFEQHMRIPLIIRYPARLAAGQRITQVIGQYHLFPSILDLAGFADVTIENSPGRSFVPLISEAAANSDTAWKDEAFFEFVTVRVIRTPRWKYMKRLGLDNEEPGSLFDMQADPAEKNNLVDDPAMAAVRTDLDGRLTDFFGKYADPRYDLWNGGTAKGRLLEEHYGKDHIFLDAFPQWQPPVVEKAVPFGTVNN
ncbi:MAG: sulfatase-like hydrolase/transferase [Gammaproteobacteria bacterium]|nr:sulfatase-like hydrolase/transferase [Gammaproteobacteria bacterium]